LNLGFFKKKRELAISIKIIVRLKSKAKKSTRKDKKMPASSEKLHELYVNLLARIEEDRSLGKNVEELEEELLKIRQMMSNMNEALAKSNNILKG
jgi:hypothetical protein